MEKNEIIDDFRHFLHIIWVFLNLPEPSIVQYMIAHFLQSCTGGSKNILEAFRGIGKSWITAAFACFLLYRNPEVKILIVSATEGKALEISRFIRKLLELVPMLQHLKPDKKHRDQDNVASFDVAGSNPAIAPSVKCLGIFGHMTGSRADVIIADDIETSENSVTKPMREKIDAAVKEFDDIVVPTGFVLYLGTPHSEMSLYNKLADRTYKTFIIPARFPDIINKDQYGDKLAPYMRKMIVRNPEIIGKPTEPSRFGELILQSKEATHGRSRFNMQYMLDTTLSDQNKYPLKLLDLVIMDLDNEVAPEKVVWSSDPKYSYNDLWCVGLGNDRFVRPMDIKILTKEGEREIGLLPYQCKTMIIDPSGRGSDETAYGIAGLLSGQIFALELGGFLGGYEDSTLLALAKKAKEFQVQKVILEDNFGDGMFTKLLRPFFAQINFNCEIEEVKHSTNKENRIIDNLEPVMNRHKLIMNKAIIHQDQKSTDHLPTEKSLEYQLFYQLTRITREKKCLKHDDRLEVLAMLVESFKEYLDIDADVAIKQRQQDFEDEQMDAFMERALGYSRRKDNWIDEGY